MSILLTNVFRGTNLSGTFGEALIRIPGNPTFQSFMKLSIAISWFIVCQSAFSQQAEIINHTHKSVIAYIQFITIP
jgi:hypothetical protein